MTIVRPPITIVLARAINGVIGRDGQLPWHIPGDLKRFKALTMGHHIIMGRKTFESIGRILPGRTTIVVTRNSGFRVDGAVVVHDFGDAIAKCAGDTEAFVIGGEKIFQSALALADKIYLTEIDRNFDGDVYFPAIDMRAWRLVEREMNHDPEQKLDYAFTVYERTDFRLKT